MAAQKIRTIGILLFDDVEVLDFAGPFEVFSTARRMAGPTPPWSVVTVAEHERVVARGGLVVLSQHLLGAEPPIDVLLVPGGVVEQALQNEKLIAWIRSTSERAELTTSICTGAFLLAQAGLLDGRRATTHWEDAADLARTFPAVAVERDVRFVDAGNVVTSGGIAAGIDMSLYLMSRLADEPLAMKTARQMEVPWSPPTLA